MVNPLRVPLVLLGILVGMVLFVHSHRPGSVVSQDSGKDSLRLRKANELFLTSNVREAEQLPAETGPTPATQADAERSSAERAPSEAIVPSGGFLRPVPTSGQLPSVLAPAGGGGERLLPLPPTAGAARVVATPSGAAMGSSPRLAPSRGTQGGPIMHRIVDGDTLRDLAARYLGSEDRYLEIFEANRDKLVRPDLLPLGVKIRVPAQRP